MNLMGLKLADVRLEHPNMQLYDIDAALALRLSDIAHRAIRKGWTRMRPV